jgi:hypothetical protein
VYYCSIPGRFKIHSFRRRRRNTSDQKLVQWSGFDCDLRLQKCFGFCSSGQTMFTLPKRHLSGLRIYKTYRPINGQPMLPNGPNDASSHKLWRGTVKAEAAKLPGAGISPKPCPRIMSGGKGKNVSNEINVRGEQNESPATNRGSVTAGSRRVDGVPSFPYDERHES